MQKMMTTEAFAIAKFVEVSDINLSIDYFERFFLNIIKPLTFQLLTVATMQAWKMSVRTMAIVLAMFVSVTQATRGSGVQM